MCGRRLGEVCRQRHGSGMTITADELRSYFRSAGGADTCYPESREEWTPQNPARDQCGMTALVVQDILGGDLIISEVHVGGVQVGHHYWNRLPDHSDVTSQRTSFCRMRRSWAAEWSLDRQTLRTVTGSSTNSCAGESSKRWPPIHGLNHHSAAESESAVMPAGSGAVAPHRVPQRRA